MAKNSYTYITILLILLTLGCAKEENNSHKRGSTLLLTGNVDIESLKLDGITELDGGLTVNNTNLKNLNFLSNIKTIKGLCLIIENDSLQSLSGLQSIQNIGSLEIINNSRLESINELKNIEIDNDLLILNNSIRSIEEFHRLQRIRDFTIIEDELINLNIINSLEIVFNEIAIIGCNELTNLNELENLKTIDSGLIILNNLNLENFCGLKNVLNGEEINGFEIMGNLNNPSKEEILNSCE